MAGITAELTGRITDWSTRNNEFFVGANSNALSMIPFSLLVLLLYLVGREATFRPSPFNTQPKGR